MQPSKLFDQKFHETLAEAAHEMNRIYCAAIGGSSQPLWTDAPAWQRESAIKGVAGALAGNTPRQSHESWLAEKARTGWKYGPIKDAEKKEHPCCVPYDQLPPEQAAKDRLFLRTVFALASALEQMPALPSEHPGAPQ